MRRRQALWALGWTAGWLAGPGRAWGQLRQWPVVVVTLAGAVEVYRKASGAWARPKLRDELSPGDGARALPGGRLTLRSPMGHAVRVAPFSQVFLAEEQGGGDGPIRVRHVAGAVWVAVTPGPAPATRVEVESGPATVDVRGTGASLTLLRDGSLLVRVYHGEAALRGPGREARWRRILRGGQEALVGPAGAAPEPRALVRDAAEAGWVRWNEEQDAAGGYGAASPR